MIRTVWLAALCLVVLGAIGIGRIARTPAAPMTDQTTVDERTIGADLVQEPLIKGDRLQITYLGQEMPTRSTAPPIDPSVPDVQSMISPTETNIVSRHWHDLNAKTFWPAKSKRTAKKGKSTVGPSDRRSGTNEQTRHCDRSAAFGGLLRSLNLAPACDS
jgi:hypothetical protein